MIKTTKISEFHRESYNKFPASQSNTVVHGTYGTYISAAILFYIYQIGTFRENTELPETVLEHNIQKWKRDIIIADLPLKHMRELRSQRETFKRSKTRPKRIGQVEYRS